MPPAVFQNLLNFAKSKKFVRTITLMSGDATASLYVPADATHWNSFLTNFGPEGANKKP